LKEHANFSVPHRIQVRPHARITPHMSSNHSLITRHKICRWLFSTRAYIRVTLFHPQGMIHFSQHFIHTLSQFHYWFERWSANVHAGNFHSTAKTHCHHTRTLPVTLASHPSSPDRSVLNPIIKYETTQNKIKYIKSY